MAVAVIGAGRSGTNMVLEVLTGHPGFKPSEPPEDKQLFSRLRAVYLDEYLTKCDTLYCQTAGHLASLLVTNPQMKLVWTIRDPRDMVLSKLRAGWREGKPMVSDDATFEGCIADMYHMFDLWKRAYEIDKNRNWTAYFEDIILKPDREITQLCKWLKIPYNDDMPKFYERMRHPGKKERYGNKLDKEQVGLWKRWPEVYDGLFHPEKTKIPVDVPLLFSAMEPIVRHFQYESNTQRTEDE
jgi:hypothetical protein